MDLDDLRAAGVAGYCTPGYCSREVADFALACALAGLRGVVGLDRAMQAGVWEERAAGTTHRIRGSVLGVIGLGKIGEPRGARRRGARHARARHRSGRERRGLRRRPAPSAAELGDLLAASDVVTLHAPHVRGAPPLLGRKEFAALQAAARSSSTPRAPS